MTWSDSGECCAWAKSASLPRNRMLRDPQPFTTSCKQTRTTCAPEGNIFTVQETEQCTSALGSGGRLKDQGGALSSVRRLILLFLCLASVVTCVSPVLWFPVHLKSSSHPSRLCHLTCHPSICVTAFPFSVTLRNPIYLFLCFPCDPLALLPSCECLEGSCTV